MNRLLSLASMTGAATIAFAHFVWIGPVSPVLEKGKTARVQIGNGHEFPKSEAALSLENLKIFVEMPSGKRMDLQAAKEGTFLTAGFPVDETGTYRIAFIQDRGILSRTPAGMKPGGRDRNPTATQTMKLYRSAVAYAAAGGAVKPPAKPLGLTFEMTGQRSGNQMMLTVLQEGRPVANADIKVVWMGEHEKPAGKTGADGKFTYNAPAGAKGPMLLLASLQRKAGESLGYDTETFSTALHVSW